MMKILHNFFVPHHKNNHRAKLLHHSSLSIIVVFLLLLNFFSIFLRNSNPGVLGTSYSISENELLSMTNQMRQEKGLTPLKLNSQLSNAAQQKAQDMFLKNYWAHFAPDGGSPWDFIKNVGYSYLYAGENLAKGFTSSREVVDAWMNSETHRENLLSDKYNDIGFAISEGHLLGEDTVLIVQMFGTTEVVQPIPIAQETGPAVVSNVSVSSLPEQKSEAPVIIQPTSVPEKAVENSKLAGISDGTVIALGKSSKNIIASKPVFEVGVLSRSILFFIFSALIFALILDLLIVEGKKIPRLVGHNLDHIMMFLLFVLLILFQRNGFVL